MLFCLYTYLPYGCRRGLRIRAKAHRDDKVLLPIGERPITIVNIDYPNLRDNELMAKFVERWTAAQLCGQFEARAPKRLDMGMAG
ncbi:unnamed protein product [Schistocephalus solidus]|uniref:MOSC domain-containing protein n=1 Tax=Schistocephalus solidus TaxID=70667 RepID=A0A183S8M9_SCHSO|nr:unnamed protein product [Schistocephalus solidus]